MKYKRKPEVIEAIQWTGKNDAVVEQFLGNHLLGYGDNLVLYNPVSEQYKSKLLYIQANDGEIIIAEVFDYIVGIPNGFDVVKPDIFEQIFELDEK